MSTKTTIEFLAGAAGGNGTSDAVLSKAFNEWMRRFTEEPEKYEAEYAVIKRFLSEQSSGQEPTYGQVCTEYLRQLCAEVTAA